MTGSETVEKRHFLDFKLLICTAITNIIEITAKFDLFLFVYIFGWIRVLTTCGRPRGHEWSTAPWPALPSKCSPWKMTSFDIHMYERNLGTPIDHLWSTKWSGVVTRTTIRTTTNVFSLKNNAYRHPYVLTLPGSFYWPLVVDHVVRSGHPAIFI